VSECPPTAVARLNPPADGERGTGAAGARPSTQSGCPRTVVVGTDRKAEWSRKTGEARAGGVCGVAEK
jgi:hypothetical protein